MTAARWWSESKKAFVPLADMHNAHLMSAFRKFERGEYLPGGEPQADPLAPDEEADLREAFDAEMQRRAIGPYEAPAQGEQAGA